MQSCGQGLGLIWAGAGATGQHGSVINVSEEVSYRNRMQNVVCGAIPFVAPHTCALFPCST
jgi:hypothetical protein